MEYFIGVIVLAVIAYAVYNRSSGNDTVTSTVSTPAPAPAPVPEAKPEPAPVAEPAPAPEPVATAPAGADEKPSAQDILAMIRARKDD